MTNAHSVEVGGNLVSRVGVDLVDGNERGGIVVMGCEHLRLSGNVVEDVAPPEAFVGSAYGIAAIGPFASANATDNVIRFSQEVDGPAEGRWSALVLASSDTEMGRAGHGRTVVPLGRSDLVLTDGGAYLASARGDHATVTTNSATGGGAQPAYLVSIAGDAIAQANQCSHAPLESPVAMLLGADTVVAGQNRVRGGEGMIVIETQEDRFTALGNLAAGGTHLGTAGAGLPTPWDDLNRTVS